MRHFQWLKDTNLGYRLQLSASRQVYYTVAITVQCTHTSHCAMKESTTHPLIAQCTKQADCIPETNLIIPIMYLFKVDISILRAHSPVVDNNWINQKNHVRTSTRRSACNREIFGKKQISGTSTTFMKYYCKVLCTSLRIYALYILFMLGQDMSHDFWAGMWHPCVKDFNKYRLMLVLYGFITAVKGIPSGHQ